MKNNQHFSKCIDKLDRFIDKLQFFFNVMFLIIIPISHNAKRPTLELSILLDHIGITDLLMCTSL